MDDDEYYNQLTTQAKVRSLNDVASDVRKHLSGAVDNIIKAGQALQEGRDMHLSDNAFHDWCMQEFPDLKRQTRQNIMLVAKRFGHQSFGNRSLPITVLYELAAPSVPDELVEDIMSSDKPMKVKEVQQAKAGYKEVQENPDYGDILEDVKEKRKTPVEAAKEAWDRRAEQKEAINNTVAPKVVDLNAIARDKKETDIRSVAPAFVGLMETLCTKFDDRDIKRELVAFMYPDPLGLKAEALHKMSDILNDLRKDFSTETIKQQLN